MGPTVNTNAATLVVLDDCCAAVGAWIRTLTGTDSVRAGGSIGFGNDDQGNRDNDGGDDQEDQDDNEEDECP